MTARETLVSWLRYRDATEEQVRNAVREMLAELDDLRRDRLTLKAVHGALGDAGCVMGEIGECEEELVRGLRERAEKAEAALDYAVSRLAVLMNETIPRLERQLDEARRK